MPRGRPKKEQKTASNVIEPSNITVPSETELQHLHALYAELRALGINSIGDLEVKIARLQK